MALILSSKSLKPFKVFPLRSEAVFAAQVGWAARDLIENSFNSKLYGDEVYYSACSFLVISKNSYGKLHCQESLNLISFHIRSGAGLTMLRRR